VLFLFFQGLCGPILDMKRRGKERVGGVLDRETHDAVIPRPELFCGFG